MKRILILFLLIAKIDSSESLNTISIVGQDRGAAGQVAYEDGHGTLVPLIKYLKLTLQKATNHFYVTWTLSQALWP